MVARIRLLQIAIAAVNIAIVALAFTSIWPFPHGDFKVDLPSANEVSWTYSNGVVHVIAPFSIDNGGYYDVDNLTLHYSVVNVTEFPLAAQFIYIGDIPAGKVTSSEIDFSFDLNQGFGGMVFNDDLLRFSVEVSCFYTMKLVKFDASYQVSVPWDALIQDYGVDWSQTNLTSASPHLSYYIVTSDLLSGLAPAQVTLNLTNSSGGLVASGSTSIELGGNHSGTVDFTSDLLTLATSRAVNYSIQIAGFSLPPGTIAIPDSVLASLSAILSAATSEVLP